MADFNDCNANIYDNDGAYLGNVRIDSFDKKDNTIEVSGLADDITGACEVVILSAPVPFAFKGMARKFGGTKIITLYEGHTTEQRKNARYKTDLPGIIENLVYDEKNYKLHSPMTLQIINISKRGLRLRGRINDLLMGLRSRIRINVGKGDQILTADVVNTKLCPDGVEEFGCALYSPKFVRDEDVGAAADTAEPQDEQQTGQASQTAGQAG